MMSIDDRAKTIEQLSSKLCHSLAEVRSRALENLSFKLKHGILKADDLAFDRELPAALLVGLQYAENWPTTSAALQLVKTLAASSSMCKVLLELGAEYRLKTCRENCSPELHSQVDGALTALFTLDVKVRVQGWLCSCHSISSEVAAQRNRKYTTCTFAAVRHSSLLQYL